MLLSHIITCIVVYCEQLEVKAHMKAGASSKLMASSTYSAYLAWHFVKMQDYEKMDIYIYIHIYIYIYRPIYAYKHIAIRLLLINVNASIKKIFRVGMCLIPDGRYYWPEIALPVSTGTGQY